MEKNMKRNIRVYIYACTHVYTYVYVGMYTYVSILLHRYTCMCVHICICVYITLFHVLSPMIVDHRHCIEFPVLYGSTFLIHSLSNHLYLLVPNSQSIPPALLWQSQVCSLCWWVWYNMVSKLKFTALSGASSRREGRCAGLKDQQNALSFGGDFRRLSRVILALCVLHATCTL